MSIDWSGIESNLNTQLNTNNPNLLVKTRTHPNGTTETFRDFSDMAKVALFSRTQAMNERNDADGILSKCEIDPE